VRRAAHVTDEVDLVTDDDRRAAQVPGPHGDHLPIRGGLGCASPWATVLPDHHRLGGFGVVGAFLSAWPGVLARPDPHVVIVQPLPVARAHARAPANWSRPSILAHISGKSGSVLAVVPMSSTSTPATRR